MKWSLERKWIASGFGLCLLLMGTASLISYQNATQLIASSNQVKDTHGVMKNIIGIFATLTDAEAGRGGYILYGEQLELKRYYQAMQSLDAKFQKLQQQIADDSYQQQRLTKLKLLIAQRVELSKQSINLKEAGKSSFAIQAPLVNQSNQNRNQIRELLTQMQTREEHLLQISVRHSQDNIRNRMLIEFLGTFLSFAILLGVYTLLYQQLVKRQQAETIQKTLAQEKELSELKLRFFSMVSHEFRTPLSIILGSAQLLAQSNQQWTEEKKLKNLYRIQSSARSMNQLLTDILTLTRAEAGKLEFHPEIMDLEAFCINLIEDLQFSNQQQHTIKFVSQGNCTHAKLDENILYSILSNLLSNAIKYSLSEGRTFLILSCEPQAIIFQVKDNGIGIPSEFKEHLFEPFHRANNVGKIVGSGLGLAVVKKCLEIHHGEIYVDSEIGGGTSFTIKFPQQGTVIVKSKLSSHH
ncbi:CHASE3 domain-containing protein [Nostoc flagelliforme FACHB-838]|uniref:histidine kinase n=1 Tax=Nostoc flagelliforme FACHB-838 TaxID=2692904 RepID=A0ABR8DZB4_9NOSO|nr:ATP-binding protein [Nostoc flagelliforme]MBD2534817.1 CHASE3 domain-containing protein [Nostoc flagelliforme FACHB-838]